MSGKSNAVVWFEIPARDLERAAAFYGKILGVELTMQDMGNLRMAWFPWDPAAGGASGTLIQAESYEPSHAGTLVYLRVDDIDDVLSRVEPAGGKVLNPRTGIGEHGFVGHFEDPDGNRVGLHTAA